MFWQIKICFYNDLPTSNMRGRVPIRSGPHFGVHIASYLTTAAPLAVRLFIPIHIETLLFWQNKIRFYNGLPTSNMRGRVPIRSGPSREEYEFIENQTMSKMVAQKVQSLR